MTVSVDVVTESIRTTTDALETFSHAGGGSPKGALLLMVQNTTGVAAITSVDYGGVTLDEIGVQGLDSAGEPGIARAYFAGASIPSGTQTVTITWGSNETADQQFTMITLNGAADLEVVDNDHVGEDTANPSLVMNVSGREALAFVCIHSGLAAVGSLALLTGMTALHDHDWGNQVARSDRQTTASTSDFTIGYTSASDDVAMKALSIAEVSTGDATATPSTVAAVAAVPAPTARGAASTSPTTVAAAAAVPAPTARSDNTASPATVASVAAVLAPTARGAAVASPAAVVGTGAVPAATASGSGGGTDGSASPSTVAAAASVPAPTAQGAAIASPAMVPGIGGVPAPIARGAAVTTPNAVAAVGGVPAPTAQGAARATPAQVAGVGSVPAATAQGQGRASPAMVAGIGAVPAASASGGGVGQANPATVAAVASVPAPTVFGGAVGFPVDDPLAVLLGIEGTAQLVATEGTAILVEV